MLALVLNDVVTWGAPKQAGLSLVVVNTPPVKAGGPDWLSTSAATTNQVGVVLPPT